MSNHHLRNEKLSLKAKGLLSVILSLPEGWDYSLEGLTKICKEGICAVRSAVKELEKFGYIERETVRNEKGQYEDLDYIIHEQPIEVKPDTPKLASDKPKLENLTSDNLNSDNPTLGNRTQLNTKKSNTKELNTDLIKYPSIKDEPPAYDDGVGWIDRYNKISVEIKEQIDYETLTLYHNTELINDIVNVMAEVFVIDTSYYTIEGKQIPKELVRENYRKITFDRLEAFILDFNGLSGRIKNPKKYLITALYNIASTAETSLTNRVNSDFYRGD